MNSETYSVEAAKRVRAFYPMMIVPGIVLLLAPVTVKEVMKYFGFHESLGGLLQVSYFVGGVVGILMITRLMQRLTTRQIIVSQVLLLSAFLLASAVSPWYPLLLVFYVIAGFANGILVTFPGVYVTRVCGDRSHQAQAILYGFFSLGVVSGPVMAGLIFNSDISWRWAFVIPALMVIPLSIPVAVVKLENLENVARLTLALIEKILDTRRRLFSGLILALLLYIAAESAVSMWLVTFLEDKYRIPSGSAHWVLTGMWVGLTVGRWICSYAAKKISPLKILFFLCTVSGSLVLIAPLTGSKVATIILYPVIGLFYSGIYPFLIGYAAWFPQEYSSAVFTLFLAAGAAGGAVLPYLVGLVNQYAGISAGMSLISISIFCVIACLYLIRSDVSEGP